MSLSAIAAALEQFCLWTWQTSLHASVLIALVLVIQFAFGKRLPARLRYAFSLLVLLRLILPVAPATSFSVFNLGKHHASPLPASEIRPTTSMPAPSLAQTIDIPVKLTTAPVKASRFSLREVASTAWLSGLIISLFVVLRQHRKFSRWIRARPPLDDPRLAVLLQECKTIMRVRREARLIIAPPRTTPALFGLRKPCLLLPDGLVQKLDERELRMVFLHELAHIKRADILLNWAIIAVRSLHWFNPLVLLAMRRLCADRELVCDAMVMSQLAVNERRAYGNTLIKLLDDFSGAGFCPSLAPVINHKHEIKRRVTMIAAFKPTRGIALLLPAIIVVALCCLTFTRAAEKKGVSSGNAKGNRTAESAPANEKSQSSAQVQIENLKKLLRERNEEVLKAQGRTDQLRRELRISDAVVEDTGSIALNPETVRRLESARIKVESQYRELNSLVTLLKAKSDGELQKIINVTVPDEVLTSLLKAKAETEQLLANLSSKFGNENPEIKGLREENRKVSDQIADRVQAILAGLQVKAEVMQTQIESLHRAVDEAKAKDVELAAKYRPYFEAKRSLENLEKIRDAISLRLEQDRLDAALPGRKQ